MEALLTFDAYFAKTKGVVTKPLRFFCRADNQARVIRTLGLG